MIIIDGQIGVGKTTLGGILEKACQIPLYSELSNDDTLTLLNHFYKDKTRWSFTSQTHFLVIRFQMIKMIHQRGGGFLDRSIFGDSIFAEILHEDQHMTTEEFNTYQALLKTMLELVPPPALLIYLDCSVDVAMARIGMRNRECEQDISRDYLEKIHEKYLRWYHQYNYSPKLFVDTNHLNIFDEASRNELIQLVKDNLKTYQYTLRSAAECVE